MRVSEQTGASAQLRKNPSIDEVAAEVAMEASRAIRAPALNPLKKRETLDKLMGKANAVMDIAITELEFKVINPKDIQKTKMIARAMMQLQAKLLNARIALTEIA